MGDAKTRFSIFGCGCDRWAGAWFASGGPVSGLFIGASGEGKRRDAGPSMFLVGMHLWRAWYIALVYSFILSRSGVRLFRQPFFLGHVARLQLWQAQKKSQVNER
jgi:hypothetical protein